MNDLKSALLENKNGICLLLLIYCVHWSRPKINFVQGPKHSFNKNFLAFVIFFSIRKQHNHGSMLTIGKHNERKFGVKKMLELKLINVVLKIYRIFPSHLHFPFFIVASCGDRCREV